MNRMLTKLGKLHLQNPVTVASGTFGPEYGEFFDLNRLGAYVTKTITLHPKIGNPPPRLYETEAGLLNSIGLQNPGVDGFISKDLPLLKEKLSIPIIVSFSGGTIEEFVNILQQLEKQDGIAAYEVNISCPNVEKEGIAFGVDALVVYELIRRLRPLTSKELIIKLTPNVTDIAGIARAAEDSEADALALINTLQGMAIDPLTGQSRIKMGICGYSGTGIKPLALANVFKVAKAVQLPIIGMGGICTWQDAMEFFYAGAGSIAVGTGNFINPRACMDVLEGLEKHLSYKEITLQDIIGKVSL
ncbi:MAG: dihydroorotate dehydrogenase [Candidatus Cloacimonetes bacterium]|nr:dihydroorotate dehydrogenase [Candidatus Cloacimonadota bacterium]